MLAQQDREGISFLAGGATGDPDAYFVIRTFALKQLWDHQPLERFKGRSIAKEIGNADQEVTEQRADLVGLSLQPLRVLLEADEAERSHAGRMTKQRRACARGRGGAGRFQPAASAARAAAAMSAFVFAWPAIPQPPSGDSVISTQVRSA